ncbi:hypothetical protein OG989_04165 [Micromonospora sp. NBC_01740]|uniref:deazapurine DNA modification protein DpdA family protein n=1 Tax=Micromonospora sp. NBC_01740 TaxID=2975986 RepID=UPI002E0F21C0|nr:hypothetical protein OG989_04165 [Micromonospora sp. NBC_01740]
MDFYVGADTHWLARAGYPLMVSHGRLRDRVNLPRAAAPWVCDSRGFTELQQHGRWTFTPRQYVDALRRYRDDIGQLVWASPQDWMCEPVVIQGGTFHGETFAGTGLTVAEHQRRTVDNLLELRALLDQPGDPHIVPALQGWEPADYLRCWEMYDAAGIDLLAEPVVGLGSTCRREATSEVKELVEAFAARGVRLHAYGAKTRGLLMYGQLIASADSFSWSFGGRRRVGRCRHGVVKWEANCPVRAREWRDTVLANIATAHRRPHQGSLVDMFGVAA